ncbi:hypothetical protein ABEB36_000802 [Hypothenemus hampei]|uniref:Laminin subunit gamma-1 n=1 Tax=Hypothenemus hampei TaxID=57062 RepID=A0ABD1FD25_HYPHA
MGAKYFLTLVLIIIFCIVTGDFQQSPVIGNKERNQCYDRNNRPQKCMPEFENPAINLQVEVTNTCGSEHPQRYCTQIGISNSKKDCDWCNPGDHDAKFLTDINNAKNLTWWQSETLYEGISQVNLTIRFGKAFDITYLLLHFNSPRPESFFISKKTYENDEWTPYQYYSATCRDTYGLPDTNDAEPGKETRALCTSEYSDISPLRGGKVAFGTLEGRPSAENFENSTELQEFVTATEIMITLDKLNTFRDEIFQDRAVLRSYYYAIADIAVGARCKCNGHASECVPYTNGDYRKICKCEHNTAGLDCEKCLPFFNDAPWATATSYDANECKQCNCNGYSTRCMFDQKLYEQTGHGGHCLDCASNRDGPNCERCRPNYYMTSNGSCVACNCNETGSLFQQCNAKGGCQCKSGVAGEKCNRCAENHYDFSKIGCKFCDCMVNGSILNTPTCHPETGVCYCKENVEGRQCGECKPGYFNLDKDNEFGCTPCFCFGHSSECHSHPGYFGYVLESTFVRGPEKWKAEDESGRPSGITYEASSQSVTVRANGAETIYFTAPNRFLGDQRNSYNQLLRFSFKIGPENPIATTADIVLESGNLSVTNTIFAQKNKLPNTQIQNYKFRFNEHPNYGWQPRLTSRSFMALLMNLTSIKIKGTFSSSGIGYLKDFKLETALRGIAGQPASWIEFCQCPTGYVGQNCESCAAGYRHTPANGGPFTNCIPCDCNNHADICDPETGKCICQNNTAGENCEYCARGFYGNPFTGTPEDCRPCSCPDNGPCMQISDNKTMCTECPTGYTGLKCEMCSDGYFGDPSGKIGTTTVCQQCECNLNIDPNAVGNCNTTTGECLRCIHNTTGPQCEICLPGYFGNALVLPKGDCKKCECYPQGTNELKGEQICDQTTGACQCKNHVVGTNCDKCENGYFNILSGEGCQKCNCDPIGSKNDSCDVYTGQCHCRPGVTGLRCDHCEARKYGFSIEGCKECECDRIGSSDLQCDVTGQCPCLENVEGRKCDKCKENKYNRREGCKDCPDCYNLIKDAYKNHSKKLHLLNETLNQVESRPSVVEDDEFPHELKKLGNEIETFYDQVRIVEGKNGLFAVGVNMRERGKEVTRNLEEISENTLHATGLARNANENLDHAEEILIDIEERLIEVTYMFDEEGKRAFANAADRSHIVGQQSNKMTQMAKEARDIADYLDERSINLVTRAIQAKNQSKELYEQIKSAQVVQQNITRAAEQLKFETVKVETKLNKSKVWLKQVNNNAGKVKNEAVEILTELNNWIVPPINVAELKDASNDLKNKAYRLQNKSRSVLEDVKQLQRSLQDKKFAAEKLKEDASEQQEYIEGLKNDIDFCNAQSVGAINLWNEKLRRAEENLQDLSESDNKTQESKAKAKASLENIPIIEGLVNEITNRTKETENILEDADDNVESALEEAMNANNLAKNSSFKTKQIHSEAETLHKNTTLLKNEVGLMYDRVLTTEAELKNVHEKFRSNSSLVQDVKEKVGRAGKDTDTVKTKVTHLLSDVESIIIQLDNTPDIDEEEVNRLEEAITKIQRKLQENQLEERLEELQKRHKFQNDLIETYKNQLKVLEEDVINIEQILKSLPDDCYKRVELEP